MLELLISIAILTIACIPLIGYPFFHLKKEREKLLSIELQREAEILFYEILKNFKRNHPEWHFTRERTETFPIGQPLCIEIDGIDATTYFPHYHLYHNRPYGEHAYYKLWCTICFPKEEQHFCSRAKKGAKNPYTFTLLVKQIDSPQRSSEERATKDSKAELARPLQNAHEMPDATGESR